MQPVFRRLAALPLILGLGLGAGMADAAIVLRSPGKGQVIEVDLPGNPSTGYRWVLNAEASQGLEIVEVEMRGYGAPESDLIGAPAPFRIQVICTLPGQAQLRLDYLSPDGSTVARSEDLHVTCD